MRKRIVEEAALVVANGSVTPRRDGVITSKDLDAAVATCKAADARAASGIVVFGRELARIKREALWKMRIDEESKAPVHKTWAAFVRSEFDGMHVATADRYIAVVEQHQEKEIVRFGMTKLGLLVSAPKEKAAEAKRMLESGASKRAIEEVVRTPKKKAEPLAEIDTRTVAMFAETSVPANAQRPEPVKVAPKTDAGADDEQLVELHRGVMRLANDWKGKTYAPVITVLRKIVETLEARDRAKEAAR